MPYIVTDSKHLDRDVPNEIALVGDLWYKKPFKIHRNVGSDNQAVICPTTWGKKCPICEYRKKRLSEGAEKEETDSMKTSDRNLYCVIPLGEDKHDEEPHVWDVSQFLFQKLLNTELDEDLDNAVFPDLEEGLSLRIRFDKKTFASNEYAQASRIDFKERDEAYDDDILDTIPNLDDMLKELSYDEIERMFFELDDVDASEEPESTTQKEEEKPKRHRKTTTKAKEEEEKPKRRKKAAKEPDPEEDDLPFSYENWEEINILTSAQLEDITVEEDLGIDASDYDDDLSAFKKVVAEALGIEIPAKKTTRRRKTATKEKPSKNKCPHGHVFGKDTDEFDECDECPLWDDCIDAMES